MQGGIYRRIRPAAAGGPLRPAVFLDRDGVIVEDAGYLSRVEDIRYIEGSLQAVAELNKAGFLVIIVTNQSGIARGYYGWPEFEAVQNAIETQLEKTGGWFDGVWACPFYPDHPFRKPNPGMLLEAAQMLNADLSRSAMVGDKQSDVEAGLGAGVARICWLGGTSVSVPPANGDSAKAVLTRATNLFASTCLLFPRPGIDQDHELRAAT